MSQVGTQAQISDEKGSQMLRISVDSPSPIELR